MAKEKTLDTAPEAPIADEKKLVPTCAPGWVAYHREDREDHKRELIYKQHHGLVNGFDGFHKQTLDLHHQTCLLEAILLTLGEIKTLMEANSGPATGAKVGKK